eukprot:scaffold57774_cov35-Phaeocystis_antarctica.AAC.3
MAPLCVTPVRVASNFPRSWSRRRSCKFRGLGLFTSRVTSGTQFQSPPTMVLRDKRGSSPAKKVTRAEGCAGAYTLAIS